MSTPATSVPAAARHGRTAPLRFVSAASLFDGHDAAINIIRRLLQAHGAEVIHLGHNRSVAEVVNAALQEDADAIACSSYQGGHMEYFKYMVDMLRAQHAEHIRVVVGGGGTIAPREVAELEAYGVEKVYEVDVSGSPDEAALRALAEGVELEDGVTAPADVRCLAPTKLELTLHEGKNRQVKRMLEAVGHSVRRLNRRVYAGLTVEGLAPGEWRELSRDEVERLRGYS